jgi:hypothetical protein
VTQTLERQNFPPNKTVADRRIVVNQVGDLHEAVLGLTYLRPENNHSGASSYYLFEKT